MKKHYFFMGIILFSVVFIYFALFWNGSPPPPPPPPPSVESDLDVKIQRIDGLMYNEASIDSINTTLMVWKNQGKLNATSYENYNNLLDNAVQNSLANSINDWAVNSCVKNNISSIISKANAFPEKTQKLKAKLSIYQSYQNAMAYSGKLNSFLSGYYTDASANSLKNAFLSEISGKPFSSCGLILSLKNKIDSEIIDFKVFVGTYINKMGDPKNNELNKNKWKFYYYTEDINNLNKLNKYKYYSNDFKNKSNSK